MVSILYTILSKTDVFRLCYMAWTLVNLDVNFIVQLIPEIIFYKDDPPPIRVQEYWNISENNRFKISHSFIFVFFGILPTNNSIPMYINQPWLTLQCLLIQHYWVLNRHVDKTYLIWMEYSVFLINIKCTSICSLFLRKSLKYYLI